MKKVAVICAVLFAAIVAAASQMPKKDEPPSFSALEMKIVLAKDGSQERTDPTIATWVLLGQDGIGCDSFENFRTLKQAKAKQDKYSFDIIFKMSCYLIKEGTIARIEDKNFVEGGWLVRPEGRYVRLWTTQYYRWLDSDRPFDFSWLKGVNTSPFPSCEKWVDQTGHARIKTCNTCVCTAIMPGI